MGLVTGLILGQLISGHIWAMPNSAALPSLAEGEKPFRPIFTLDQPLLAGDAGDATPSTARFRLPKSARQGEPLWYILDVTIEVDFNSLAPPGAFSYVSVLTDGHAAAMVGFSREIINGQAAVRWNTRDLLTGSTQGLLFDQSMNLHIANYLQRRGVQPGDNELSLRVEHLSGGAAVSTARLLPGSEIAVGPLGPPALRLQGAVSTNRVRVGDTLTLDYRVTSQGYPAAGVGVRIDTSAPGLINITAPHQVLEWVGGVEKGRQAQLQGMTPGHYEIRVRAQGQTGGTQQLMIPVEVVDAQE
jgi:hypothetical protein